MSEKIVVILKSNSKVEKIEKSEDVYLVHVKEPPIDNRANQALIRVIAAHLHIVKSKIRIIRGLKSKKKILEIIE